MGKIIERKNRWSLRKENVKFLRKSLLFLAILMLIVLSALFFTSFAFLPMLV
jgi:hypothetical protein